ncbi:MAG: DUF1549 and DUF1553 domain-containing protein [Gemmataceae bacterium]
MSRWTVIFMSLCLVLGSRSALAQLAAAPKPLHWSFLPRGKPMIPQVTDPNFLIRNPIDAFILERLRRAGLRPAPAAERRTLIRRLSFDLIGLPPTPAEIDAFVQDEAPDAYERLVDRLLASPHYGERWARHWLDVVRYAETEGFEYDAYRPGAWRYRDYVIRAFNADKPYDQFICEQLAGDEIDPDNSEFQIAAGFHRLGPVRRNAGNQEVAASRNEVLTERTDAIGAVFLGLTVACARCHDHMFDAIGQTDYYRLQAFLAATHDHDIILASKEEQAEWQAQTDAVRQEIQTITQELARRAGAERESLEARFRAAQKRLPPPLPTISTVRHRADQRTPIHVLTRGEWERKGPRVGMQALSALLPDATPELPPDTPKPRTVLARWIASPDNPLTARVLVNRVWHYHFGRGIVATPNDFGLNGSPPSHPELLDWLANQLVAGDPSSANAARPWSLKALHRLIVTSSTYRQASRSPDQRHAHATDPDNALLWHFPRRRLDAEQIRDAMLAIAGQLNREAGGPSVVLPVDADLVRLLYDPAQWTVTEDAQQHRRRSIYLLAKRNLRLPFAEVLDQPDAQISCPRRESSTHALQALEMLNGAITNELAAAFADRLRREAGSDPSRQIEQAFLLATGRPPTPREHDLALRFRQTQPLRELTLALFNLNAVLYVE